MTGDDDEDWVEVAGASNEDKAALIAGLLQSEGIPCEVEGPRMTPFPEDLGSFGVSRVMVPPDRADEARALIALREREYESRRGSDRDAREDSEE